MQLNVNEAKRFIMSHMKGFYWLKSRRSVVNKINEAKSCFHAESVF